MAGHSDGGGGWSQADLRRPAYLKDQHGRTWFADIEKRSGFPVGPIRARFSAPWYPDQGSFRFSESDPSHFAIDYEWLLSQRMEAHDEYHQRAVEESATRQWDVPERGEPYSRNLQLIVGRPPNPIEPIVAAMQGNKWILGLSKKVDERLAPFITTPETKREQIIRSLPDFRDDPYGDMEEQFDPEATGGKVERRRGRKPTPVPDGEAA